MALSQATFGQGTGSIWLDQVGCVGTEGRLADCPANPIGIHDCQHSEDAGVRCPGKVALPLFNAQLSNCYITMQLFVAKET